MGTNALVLPNYMMQGLLEFDKLELVLLKGAVNSKIKLFSHLLVMPNL